MRKLNIETLKKGTPTLSKNYGSFLFEAATYCLEENKHSNGVTLNVTGSFNEEIELTWKSKNNKATKHSWRDLKEATEYGATAIAILLLETLTNYKLADRAIQTDKVDYWLEFDKQNSQSLPFEHSKAVLEISGIWNESSSNSISMRINSKKKHLSNGQKITSRFRSILLSLFFSLKSVIVSTILPLLKKI